MVISLLSVLQYTSVLSSRQYALMIYNNHCERSLRGEYKQSIDVDTYPFYFLLSLSISLYLYLSLPLSLLFLSLLSLPLLFNFFLFNNDTVEQIKKKYSGETRDTTNCTRHTRARARMQARIIAVVFLFMYIRTFSFSF